MLSRNLQQLTPALSKQSLGPVFNRDERRLIRMTCRPMHDACCATLSAGARLRPLNAAVAPLPAKQGRPTSTIRRRSSSFNLTVAPVVAPVPTTVSAATTAAAAAAAGPTPVVTAADSPATAAATVASSFLPTFLSPMRSRSRNHMGEVPSPADSAAATTSPKKQPPLERSWHSGRDVGASFHSGGGAVEGKARSPFSSISRQLDNDFAQYACANGVP